MNFPFLSDNLLLRDLKIYALVLLLAAISWGLVELFRVEYQADETIHEAPKHSADYFSTGYLRKDLDKQGHIKSQLSAQSILHYSDDGITHIDKPMLTLYNTDHSVPPWVIKSDKGILSADGENLLLQGQVLIARAKAAGIQAVTINTSDLQVKPRISYAQSDKWAQLLSPPHRIEGKGIQMIFKKPIHIKLLSNVKSRYVLN
jgi:lipopolysaccharide export system protein LptC